MVGAVRFGASEKSDTDGWQEDQADKGVELAHEVDSAGEGAAGSASDSDGRSGGEGAWVVGAKASDAQSLKLSRSALARSLWLVRAFHAREASVFHVANTSFWEAAFLPIAVVVVAAFSSCMDLGVGRFVSLLCWYVANFYTMSYAFHVLHPQVHAHPLARCSPFGGTGMLCLWSIGIVALELAVHDSARMPEVGQFLGTALFGASGCFWLHAVLAPWNLIPEGLRPRKVLRYAVEKRLFVPGWRQALYSVAEDVERQAADIAALAQTRPPARPRGSGTLRAVPPFLQRDSTCAGHIAFAVAGYALFVSWRCTVGAIAYSGPVGSGQAIRAAEALAESAKSAAQKALPKMPLHRRRQYLPGHRVVRTTPRSVSKGFGEDGTWHGSSAGTEHLAGADGHGEDRKLGSANATASTSGGAQQALLHARAAVGSGYGNQTWQRPTSLRSPIPASRVKISSPTHVPTSRTTSIAMHDEALSDMLSEPFRRLAVAASRRIANDSDDIAAGKARGSVESHPGASAADSAGDAPSQAASSSAALAKPSASTTQKTEASNAVAIPGGKTVAIETTVAPVANAAIIAASASAAATDDVALSEAHTSDEASSEEPRKANPFDRRRAGRRKSSGSEFSSSKERDAPQGTESSGAFKDKADGQPSAAFLEDREMTGEAMNSSAAPLAAQGGELVARRRRPFARAALPLPESTASPAASGMDAALRVRTAAQQWGQVIVAGTIALGALWACDKDKQFEFSVPYLLVYNVLLLRVPDVLGHTVVAALQDTHYYTSPALATTAISLAYMCSMQAYILLLGWVCSNMTSAHLFPRFHYVAQMYYYLFWYMMLMVMSPGGIEDWSFWVMVAMLNGNILVANIGILQHLYGALCRRSSPAEPPLKTLFDSKLAVQDQLADIVSLLIVPAIATSFHVCSAIGTSGFPVAAVISLWQRFGALLFARMLSGLLTEEIFRRRLAVLNKADVGEMKLCPLEASHRLRYMNDVGSNLALEPITNIQRCEVYFTAVAVACTFSVFNSGGVPTRYSFIAFGA